MKEYYDRRALEYDETSYEAADAEELLELAQLREVLGALPPGRTLDVTCGTTFLTRYLHGEIVGLDQSEEMLRLASERLPRARFVRGDAIPLPFPDDSFDRVFTSNFYGHLERPDPRRFLAEASRVAPELVVVDCSWTPRRVPEASRSGPCVTARAGRSTSATSRRTCCSESSARRRRALPRTDVARGP